MSHVIRQINFLNAISYSTKKPQILLNATKYSGLRLTFQVQNHNGHMGARKFWHEYLPTLKFYNPNLKFDVIRISNPDKRKRDIPCTLEILGKEDQVLGSIDMRNKQYDEIMDQLSESIDHTTVPEQDLVKVQYKAT
ncbi:mitochondrial 54S ribosomal protein mL61 NDAI_0A00950 [Naumovozyma dairenensis CBS 421]|uniref:Ribosomal protein/NADH dehydrogenase domain-containing protein n=1 Tax=Naumovozyma dairenensis (strain ATCC 10597 / BCRC 20456 / CBS 421 / NBRC 0211 / NRRL Y-12639) TaxID=1071378 RepID=G0W365_NAUDC|nr:hypothetical protein NDAI_0A00950 [Naumovozyma dairenensis CBS 421]CCD22253.1 hypothetical protein NDAI_0A00950 [Naumovozyma dairenensis CBS 421]